MRVLNDVQIPGMCNDYLHCVVDSIWDAGPFKEIELSIGIGQIVEWVTGEEVNVLI